MTISDDQRLQRALAEWDGGPYMAFLQPSTDAIIRVAAIRPGQRVLDVGSGFGDPSLDIAAVVGPQGRVVGVDHDRESVEIARRRAAQRGFRNVEFHEMDVPTLQFSDGSFDAAVSRNVVVYFNDPLPFLREQHRVLVPGGRIAVSVWGPNERNPLMTSSFQVLRRYEAASPAQQPAAAPGTRMNTSDPKVLEQALQQAGFVGTASGAVPLTLSGGPEVAETYWEQRRAGSPASLRVLVKLTEEERARAEAEIVDIVRKLIAEGRATGEMTWAVGRKP
jgi:ubiquinone/menaquinone biosynthesis C-methylase UbiE